MFIDAKKMYFCNKIIIFRITSPWKARRSLLTAPRNISRFRPHLPSISLKSSIGLRFILLISPSFRWRTLMYAAAHYPCNKIKLLLINPQKAARLSNNIYSIFQWTDNEPSMFTSTVQVSRLIPAHNITETPP